MFSPKIRWFVAFPAVWLLGLCLLHFSVCGVAAESMKALPSTAPAVDAYIPCHPIKEQWSWSYVLLPVEPVLEGAGIDLDLGELTSENALQWKGNPYTLILVDEDINLVDDPLPPVQPILDGRYHSSILYLNELPSEDRSVADAWSITMPEFEMSGYCGSSELGPYMTDAFVREGVLYYPHFTLELILNDFGLHGEWLEDSSCFHIWSYAEDEYAASDWAVPEIVYSIDKGLTHFPTSTAQYEGEGFSYANPIQRGPFLALVKNTYYHVCGRDLPDEQAAQLVGNDSVLADSITREEALLVLDQVFPITRNSPQDDWENVFLDASDFSSAKHLHSAEVLFHGGILKGVQEHGGYSVLPQNLLTREQAISLCVRVFQQRTALKEG